MIPKVAIITPYPEAGKPIGGGVEAAAVVLARALVANRLAKVQILSFCRRPVPSYEEQGIPIHWLPTGGLPGCFSYWTLQRQALLRKLRELDLDMVHVQGLGGWTIGCHLPQILTIHGIPGMDVLHEPGLTTRLRSKLLASVEGYAQRRVNGVIVINPYVRQVLAGRLGGARCWDIDNPIDPAYFDIVHQPVTGRLLFVGRISQRKNIMGLLEGFATLLRDYPAASLHLVGRHDHESYLKQCQARSQELGVAERVKFIGPLSVAGVAKELASAAGLVLPSFQETAPIVVSQALAAGVPVAASNGHGLPFMVADGQTGMLFDPTDPADIAHGLLGLLTKLAGNAECARQCQAAAREHYHPEAVARQTQAAYLAVLGGGGNA